MISSLSWIPKGAAAQRPQVEAPEDDEELMLESETATKPTKPTATATKKVDTESDTHPVDDVPVADDDMSGNTDDDMDGGGDFEGDEEEKSIDPYAAASLQGLIYYKNGEEDPNIVIPEGEEEDKSELDDLVLRDTDLLIAAASHEEDLSSLVLYVYEEADANLYVHHDVTLDAFPLCVEWTDFQAGSGQRGNFCAVGTFLPYIDVWDMDVIHASVPVVTLGGFVAAEDDEDNNGGDDNDDDEDDDSTKKSNASLSRKDKKKLKKKLKQKEKKTGKSSSSSSSSSSGGADPMERLQLHSHRDAVLGLAWNTVQRNVLASCSADCTVKLWDLSTAQCVSTLTHHTGKVQSVRWAPPSVAGDPGAVLATGGFDRRVFLVDARTGGTSGVCCGGDLGSDVESIVWNPHRPHELAVSTEGGMVVAMDVRTVGGSTAAGAAHSSSASASFLFRLEAHGKACSAVQFNPILPDLMATASSDRTVKLWNTQNDRPSMITCEKVGIGALFSLGFSRDAPHLLGIGGNNSDVHVWNLLGTAATRTFFQESLIKH